jgi:SAM-dependent methyltransferase
MADFPIELEAALAGRLARALDVEAKIPRALETLGPVDGRDVYLVDGPAGGVRASQLEALGARVVAGGPIDTAKAAGIVDASMDVVVGCWTPFRGVIASEIAEAGRILRPGGRLLALHDYGRDDVSRLHGERPEYTDWSRRDGPFLRGGFKIRVIHCFWTFESIEDGQGFLTEAFGDLGQALGAAMTRPRLSYNVAVYHRSFDGGAAPVA